jgi:transposase
VLHGYYFAMFVRKNKNRSGSISVQIISKERGKYRVVETVGTSSDPDQIQRLCLQAASAIRRPDPRQSELFALHTSRDHIVENLVSTLANANVRTIGPELIFGTLFERMGFNQIPDILFRHLVVTRLAFPGSKLKTIDYLYRYQGVDLTVGALYSALDRLHSRYKEKAESLVYQQTRKRVRTLTAIFYDVTTLYFEAEHEDDLRRTGFSKDGKFEHPQIMLGLLVGEGGLPIGYDVFEGNTFEGHTLIRVLERFERQYGFARPVVIADAAMLSKKNLDHLADKKYRFIMAARIKNESAAIQHEILTKSKGMQHGEHFVIRRRDGNRLIISYSDARAYHDRQNREKGVERLGKRVKTGQLTKEHLNKRGYNKFLVLDGEVEIHIDADKIAEDQQWDGLKGYLTNTRLNARKVIDQYGHLWQIEKAFRISKTDLRVRPIYHYRRRRIEAHLCIAFVAYAIYKELEQLLREQDTGMSPERAAALTHTMYEIEYTLPDSKVKRRQLLAMSDEQRVLFDAVMSST